MSKIMSRKESFDLDRGQIANVLGGHLQAACNFFENAAKESNSSVLPNYHNFYKVGIELQEALNVIDQIRIKFYDGGKL